MIFCFGIPHYLGALSVKIASPRNGSRFDRCTSITLKSEADIQDTDIRRIVFYRDGRVVKTVTKSPWEYTMENVPDGIYEIHARLTDRNNESVLSETNQLFVGPIADGDKIKNGEFACGLAPWNLSVNSEAIATLEIDSYGWLSDESSMAYIDIENPGSLNWHVMLTQPCPIDSGHTYDIYFLAEVEDNKTIGVDFQSTTGDYPVHFWQSVELTSGTYEYGPFEFFCPVTDPSNEFKLAISENNQSIYFDAIQVIDKNWVKNETGINEPPIAVANGYALLQNYPNPFNPATEIKFTLPVTAQVKLSIYNVHGQLVRKLVDEVKSAGTHTVAWDGRDENGLSLPSAVYIYKINTAAFTTARRMVLIK
ncbi:T9SS type A sorting domain-containing protein [candidate division KSB1 bacterium]|nr:T9SS type A sorting domain-containing protein [candidate division KSB1 bacterium]